MNCDAIREQLSAYLDGELEAEEAEQVREHLASCEACRKELASLEELTGVLRALPRHKAPGEIEREVVTYIERDLLLRAPTRSQGWAVVRKTLGMVTLAAASALIAVGVYVQFHQGERASLPEHGAREYFAGKGRDADDLGGSERFKKGADGRDVRRFALMDKTDSLGLKEGDTGLVQSHTEGTPRVAQTVPEGEIVPHAGEATVPGPAVAKALERPTPEIETVVAFDAEQSAAKLSGDTRVGGSQVSPAGPEVFEVVLAADDFESARNRVVAVAASLGVHPVATERSFEYAGKARLPVNGRTSQFWANSWRRDGTIYGEVTGQAGAGPGGPEESRLAAVLAVDEHKLPQLVARLVAQRSRFRGDGYAGDRLRRRDQSGEGEPATEVAHVKAMPSLRVEDRPPDAVEAKLAEAHRAEDRPTEPDESVRQQAEVTRDENLTRSGEREVAPRLSTVLPDGKEKADELATPKDEARQALAPIPPKPAVRDLKETFADEELKQQLQKRIQEVRLVYVRIYLTVPKPPARETAPAAEPPPATRD